MQENKVVKHIGWKNPKGKIRGRRLRRKWREAVNANLAANRVSNWRKIANDIRLSNSYCGLISCFSLRPT